jgi:DNA invertase Pin-like site-specific DNA recombinase
MESKIFGYVRVSSRDQNVSRQVDALKKYVASERDIFIDRQSGHTFNREAYQNLKYQLRRGDTVYIKSLDRFGRNKNEIREELAWFQEKGVVMRILDLPTTLVDFGQFGDLQKAIMEMVNNVLLEVLGTFAEQERNFIRERQAEGIRAARAKGIKLGRPSATYPENWEKHYQRWKAKEISATEFMRETRLSRTTFYRLIKKLDTPHG